MLPQNSDTTYSKQRIVRNTGLLYGRMLLTVWFNLWATRLTLANLGVDDLGVFGVVGSVVSMFAVFSNGLTTAVQRFITYELGRGEKGEVDRVFSTSLNVLLLLALATVIIIEPVGLCLINHKLNIPEGSLTAAHWVFQFTVLAFLFEIIAIPYNALVIAHEKMDAFAAISILKVLLTCAAAWSLSLFSSGRLIVYGALMAAIAIFIRIIYQVYCHRHFAEARYHISIDRAKMGEISRFAGVSTLGGILYTISGEGIMLVINWTFGVAINAVYTIALQLKNMILSFALNLFKAIQPQITKTYAEGALDVHRRLVYSGSKLEVYLIYFLMLPFLCRTEQIMALWLGDVPAYAVSYAQGIVFISLTYAAFEPIRTAVLATGRIVKFMLIPDSLTLRQSHVDARFNCRDGDVRLCLACLVGSTGLRASRQGDSLAHRPPCGGGRSCRCRVVLFPLAIASRRPVGPHPPRIAQQSPPARHHLRHRVECGGTSKHPFFAQKKCS